MKIALVNLPYFCFILLNVKIIGEIVTSLHYASQYLITQGKSFYLDFARPQLVTLMTQQLIMNITTRLELITV